MEDNATPPIMTWTDEADYQAEMADDFMMRERHIANALATFDEIASHRPTGVNGRRWTPAGCGLLVRRDSDG